MDPGDPDEPSREELESRVAELEQTVSKMLPDRRGVIKGLGAAALGGAAVGASSGGASAQSAAGQVGTESEPVDVEAASVAAQSVTSNGVTIAPAPSDNLSTAVSQAAIQGNQATRLTIDLSAGTYSTSDDVSLLEFEDASISKVDIIGSTDTNGDPDAILDASSFTFGLRTVGTDISVQDVAINGASSVNIDANRGAGVECQNVTVENGGSRNAYIKTNSTLQTDSSCSFDSTGVTGADANVEITGNAVGQLQGSFIGTGGADFVLRPKQNSWLFVFGNAEIDANGTTRRGINGLDAVDIKIDEATFRNAQWAVRAAEGCNVKTPGPLTYDNVTNEGIDLREGTQARASNEDSLTSLSTNAGEPTAFDLTGGWAYGHTHFNTDQQIPQIYNAAHGGIWMTYGRRQVSNVTPSEMGDLELAFDSDRGGTGNNAIIISDNFGNAYYVDLDGAL